MADIDWDNYIWELLSPKEAYANQVTVGPGAGSGIPHQINVPPGTCRNYTFPDDDTSDSDTPSMKICMMYWSLLYHHFDPMQYHLIRNAANFTSGSTVKSVVDCMKHYNGANSHKYPVLLEAKVYAYSGDLNAPGICGQVACGCAPGSPSTANCDSPNCNAPLPTGVRKVKMKTIYIASENTPTQSCERNGWGVIRHEMLHQYGYGHCHMEKNLKNTSRCIDGTKGGACNPPPGQSNPPDHRFF